MKGKRVKNRTANREEQERRRSQKRRSSVVAVSVVGPRGQKQIPPSEVILPEDFRLSENFSQVAGCIVHLRRQLARRIRGMSAPYVNFDNIARVDNAAALMLAAEIDAWNTRNPHRGPLRSHDESWDPDVCQLFDTMGLFKLLQVDRQSLSNPAHASESVFMPFISHSRVDLDEFSRFRKSIESEINQPLARRASHYLFAALSEAVTNAVQHAYRGDEKQKWWVSASYKKATGKLSILCYDRGLTIPKTLPHSGKWEVIRGIIGNAGLDLGLDSDLIKGALMTRRTATRAHYRGHGLPQLMNFIDEVNMGALTIYSRRGKVIYSKNEIEKQGKYSHESLSKPIEGTLIEWNVSLTAVENGGISPPR